MLLEKNGTAENIRLKIIVQIRWKSIRPYASDLGCAVVSCGGCACGAGGGEAVAVALL